MNTTNLFGNHRRRTPARAVWIGFLTLAAAYSVAAGPSKAPQIQTEIDRHHLGWRAGETTISALPPAERKLRLGGRIPADFVTASGLIDLTALPGNSRVPSSLDWRSVNGVNWMTGVRDQQSCGSCWAFGTIAAVEAIFNIEKNTTALPLDLSEQHLVSCSGAGNCAEGGYDHLAAEYIRTSGVPLETCYPYSAIDASCSPCTDWTENRFRILDWGWVTQNYSDETAIINALQSGPLVVWLEVYDDFYYYTGGVYHKTPGASYEGGHNVALVGYDTAGHYWICKNSWGTGWGDHGYFLIGHEEVGMGQWVLRMAGVRYTKKSDGIL